MQLSLTESFFKFLEWAYNDQNDSFVKRWRTQRFRSFLDCVNPPKSAKILDLGGSSYIWELMEHNFQVTIVNLPNNEEQFEANCDRYTYVEGDATDLRQLFADQSFDVIFSNSVIEHVGDEGKQAAFAAEVQRLGKAYWIQTPSDRFPLEVHTGMLFYWQLPKFVQQRLKKSWRKKNPNWAAMVEGTRVLSRRKMRQLFPDAEIFSEQKLGFEKSYAAYRSF
ncbi:MAG: methyltransferase domain-containing protein [Leptolyngbya sp. Prado105]|jgi:trans-aconitate methyltransferase|nr:methyltransferase domain-containing protein [Leptolyngbya sp. Prado105]